MKQYLFLILCCGLTGLLHADKPPGSYELTLGNAKTTIMPSDLPDGTGQFVYFTLNEMPDFVEEGARLIAERIQSLQLANPYFVTPEASTIAIAHCLRTKYNIPGMVLSKRKKPSSVDTVSQEYCAITSLDSKTLYMEKSHDWANKDIVIFDNVCTTGETIKAVYKLLCKAGAPCENIVDAIVLYTEGDPQKEVKISEEIALKLHAFEHIPILPPNPASGRPLFELYSSCDLPTHHGTVKFCVFRHRSLNVEAIAYISPLTFHDGNKSLVALRVHDACITSEVFHSIKCDCQLQLEKAIHYITQFGGIVIYLNQEGRGIGLGNKIAAYNLQETLGLDTVEANRKLGLPDDMREYIAVRDILNAFGVQSVMLMTNNCRKIESLKKLGITVSGTIPCIVTPESPQMALYMQTKVEKMGHTIPFEKLKAVH